jgi:hypothetical protein
MASGYGLAGGTYNALSDGYMWELWSEAERPERAQWHNEERIWIECEERRRRLHDAITYADYTNLWAYMEGVLGDRIK